jgi:type IV pilus assembly protein PilC
MRSTEATEQIQKDVSTGFGAHHLDAATGVFPNMVLQMASIGEESGSLDHMLGKAAEFYEDEVDEMVKGLSSLMEPIIIVILGTVIGGIVVSMYLPIFKLGAVV